MSTQAEDDHIEDLFALHLEVLTHLLQGKSFDWIQEELVEKFERTNYLDLMKRSGNLSFNTGGKLIGAYPISPVKTEHRIEVEGVGAGYAMCAIDALGVAYTFGTKTVIETKDRSLNTPLRIIIDPSRETQTHHDLLITYKKFVSSQTDSVTPAVTQCPVINFYSSSESVPSDPSLEIFTYEEAINYAKHRFSPSMIKTSILNSIEVDMNV